MMLFLGFLGLLQAIFLPGVILALPMFRIRSWWLLAAVIFALSLLVNYALIWVLVLCSLYTHRVMLAIFIVEAALLARIAVKMASSSSKTGMVQPGNMEECAPSECCEWEKYKFLIYIALFYSIFLMLDQCGGIFTSWDAVVSYNRWALSWAKNSLPVKTWHYPQMIPILYSVPYVLMGNNEVQFFSFAIFLFFLPLSIAVCLSLQAYREYFFAALVLAAGNLAWYLKIRLYLGYADFPALYFDLLSMVTLLLWRRSGAAYGNRMLLLSMLFGAGAAVTKQAGLFWLFLLPFAIWENAKGRLSRRQIWRLGGFFLMVMIFAASWYIYTEVQIAHGRLQSEVFSVTEAIHQGRSLFERWLRSVELWPKIWPLWLMALSGLAVRGMRAITLMGLIYTLCWSLFFSYDERNLSVAIPFLFWSTGIGTWKMYECARQRISGYGALISANKKALVYLFGAALIFSMMLCVLFSNTINSYLVKTQNEKLMGVGNKNINILLLRAMREKKLPLISDYQPALALPEISENLVVRYNNLSKFLSTYKKPYYVMMVHSVYQKELKELSRTVPMRVVGTADGVNLYLVE